MTSDTHTLIPDKAQFRRDSALALENPVSRTNFARLGARMRGGRKLSFGTLVEGETLQWIGNAIKQETLSQLPDLLETLEQKLTARGIQVHWAETTEAANKIVLDIAQRRKAKLVIKGKSMVSEEMELNDFLEDHDIEVVETDLGEYIIQLAGQKPSHIVAPAVHMNKEQVAKLFEEKLGEAYTVNVEEMTAMARRVLREKFKTADIGITGVNFAIADTGTIALVENEGNGRMCSTIPSVHIALMGVEKVLAQIKDLPPMIRLLTRSATGQPISTYFNWISSPRKTGELDGPEEVHVIVLDNGRSTIYQDPELRETLDCIRCGACLNICPVYTRIGGHAYQAIYMGPIGKILTPQLSGLDTAGHLSGASTLCGACYEVCPVKVPIPNLLLRLRQEASQPTPAGRQLLKGAGSGKTFGEAMVWRGWKVLHSRPLAYRAMTRLASLAVALAPTKMGPLARWSKVREIPRPEGKTLHQLLKNRASE